MRTNNSIINSIATLISNILSFIIAFVAQAIFIRILGAEYLGLNGLFTNLLSMLSIFELGIGNAIVFNLYKPIAENNEKKINSLMRFYKKTYNIIAFVILVAGILLMPFLKYIVTTNIKEINIYLVYVLFLISTVSSYIMTYKRNLIIANQKNYIINIIHMGYLVILNLSQLLIIYFTKNYYIYLIAKICCQLFENIIINIKANNDYKYLNIKSADKLDKKTEKDIFSRVRALFFHKIGGIIINGTDNIIISIFLGLQQVGLYTNYYTITSALTSLFGQIISSATASVGNLLISNNQKKSYEVFDKMRFLNSWISIFSAVSFMVIVQPFIRIWVGEEYLISIGTVAVITFNYFQKMQRISYSTFKDSAGIWREDKFVPLIESLLNIIFSIICLKLFGLAGVLMGTIISGLALWCYSYPKFVYKKLFNRSYKDYIIETINYIIIFILTAIPTYFISKAIIVNNIFLKLIINVIICLIIPNVILIIIFRKNKNYNYFKELIKNCIARLYINNKKIKMLIYCFIIIKIKLLCGFNNIHF